METGKHGQRLNHVNLILRPLHLGLEHQKSGIDLVTSHDKNGRPKTGLLRNLYDHMVDTGEYGQLIILNNTDVTPTTRYDREGSTELIFGEHKEADRTGLLLELREDHPTASEEWGKQPKLWD